MSRPVDARWPIGTPFGYKSKKNPHLWAAGKHTGTDFLCPAGTKVGATYDGVVVGVGNVWGLAYGKHQVVIESTFKGVTIRHIYAHMTKYLVKVGHHVKAGDLLGYSGAEGHAFGAHLHYEERIRGKDNFGYYDYIAPRLLAAKPFAVTSTKPTSWTVSTDLLNGRETPVTGRTLVQLRHGYKLVTNARTVVDGKAWVRTPGGKWFAARFLSAVKPGVVPPQTATVATISEASLNCGGYNAHGIATWKTRTAGIARMMLASNDDVLYVQELSAKAKAPMRQALDLAVKHRFERTTGSDGRYCYVRLSTMRVQKSGVLVAGRKTWFLRNDKQGAWHQSLHIKSGKVHSGMSTHLEQRDGADKQRVAQAVSLDGQFRAKTPGVKNRTTAGDFNSVLMVAKALVDKYGYDVAGGLTTSKKPTFVGWDGHSSKRFDWGLTDPAGNPTEYAVGTEKVSDHRPIKWKRVLS